MLWRIGTTCFKNLVIFSLYAGAWGFIPLTTMVYRHTVPPPYLTFSARKVCRFNCTLNGGSFMTHKNRSLLSAVLAILVSLGFLLSSEIRSSRAQVCGLERGCYTDFFNTCIKSQTTLPAVNIHSSGDWYVPAEELTGHCGGKRFLIVLVRPCGPPLGQRICTSGERNSL